MYYAFREVSTFYMAYVPEYAHLVSLNSPWKDFSSILNRKTYDFRKLDYKLRELRYFLQ